MSDRVDAKIDPGGVQRGIVVGRRQCERTLDRGTGAGAPGSGLGAVQREDADQLVGDDDRRREDGLDAALVQQLDAAELRIGERRRVVDVSDGDRLPGARREIRRR